MRSRSCCVALATTATTNGASRRRPRSFAVLSCRAVFGRSDLPSPALKASRCGLCVSFGVSVCRRLSQISSWAPSLDRATVARGQQREAIGPRRPRERSRYLARPSVQKSKQNADNQKTILSSSLIFEKYLVTLSSTQNTIS